MSALSNQRILSPRPAPALAVLIALGLLGSGVSQAAAPPAHAARTISLNETGHLHLINKNAINNHGFTLNEQGAGTGTAKSTIHVLLTALSTSRVVAKVSISLSGGSISGSGSANYHQVGANASFAGSMSISSGTGRYVHAKGTGLSLSGTIQRSTSAITVHVSGKVSG